ncbi:hypothetical protein ABQX22_13660 [Xanthomonas sp. WHRI 1810A]|uniref:hypothetical protein n=1 Tax=Xanthomonas sp. WHRI 1810A TaxID=3161565 RepID=UPI0032E85B9A
MAHALLSHARKPKSVEKQAHWICNSNRCHGQHAEEKNVRFNEFDQLSQDYKLLSKQLAEMKAGTTCDDPGLLDALMELSEATRNLRVRLEDLRRAQLPQKTAPKNKPALRLVK